MRQKRVMLLGGNFFQMTATKAAKELGYYVISVDYLPDNPAHKYADEYHNVSTIDKEAVLEVAKACKIDGIVSYASDVSAPTAAYVAEKLGLPTNPYESIQILTHKNLFRKFMREHGLGMPEGKSFQEKDEAYAYFQTLQKPVMVKPIDSSGSKGVVKVYEGGEFAAAWEEAISYSISKQVIIERFIEKNGYQIDGDGFIVDGKIRFFGVMDQHHDDSCAPYTPIGLSCPSIQPMDVQNEARAQIQKIFDLLHMKMGAFNFEYIVDENNHVHILEIGPRNGGNLIPDTLKVATGVNLAKYTLKIALGEDCSDLPECEPVRCASSYIIHSTKTGAYESCAVSDRLPGTVLQQDVLVGKGESVQRFRNAGMGLGAMIVAFDDTKTMCDCIDHMNDYVSVKVKKEENA